MILILFASLAIGCEEGPAYDLALLYGNWKGTGIVVNGEPAPVADGALSFSFDDKGQYSYKGGNNKEAGTYSVKGKLLVTQDQTVEGALKKQVEITTLTADSLVLNMNDNGTPMQMIFVH